MSLVVLPRPGAISVLALGGRACASAEWMPWTLKSPSWWLSRVVIRDPAARGKGLGRELVQTLQHTVAAHAKRGPIHVSPGGYTDDLVGQYAFYRRCGFVDAEDGGLVWTPP